MSSLLQTASSTALVRDGRFLRVNDHAYERLVEKIQVMGLRKDPEVVLKGVAAAAGFAVRFHPGRFADGAIENLALEIGRGLGDLLVGGKGFVLPVNCKEDRRRVLHVATRVDRVGGHTRALHHWIKSDQSSCHSAVITNQGKTPIPEWLRQEVSANGGDFVLLPQASSLCEKAKWMRDMSRQSADLVVLHHGGSDVTPTVAFAARDCPPVVVCNHADHVFWLGSSVSDMVIDARTIAVQYTVERRFVSLNAVLPNPLTDCLGHVSRGDARQALSIPKHQLVLLSVGRGEKYRPCGPFDFVATAGKILDCQPEAHLYVVGESVAGIAPYLRCPIHERLHFVGELEDPSPYRAAADIYLESFPFGSQTSLLEAALNELPVVPAYAPLHPLLVANADAVQDLLPNPQSEQEYIDCVELLIREPERRLRLGGTLRKRVLDVSVGKGWLDRLTAIYQKTDYLQHHPRAIPTTSCNVEKGDIGLSLWHVMADGKTDYNGNSWDAHAVPYHATFIWKYIGDYVEARRMAWRAVRQDPYRRATWRLFIVTLLGKAGRFIRRVLLQLKQGLATKP